MDCPENLERVQDYAVYRPAGTFSFEESVALLCDAITYCREERIGKLLIVATGITGFTEVGPEARFMLGDRAARAAQASVKAAIVVKESLLDPARFGMTVARNRGLFVSSFATESEGLAWLLDPGAE